jgi:hypothetical protein
MQSATSSHCSHLDKTCSGICTGYSTTNSCPPLIVLAVLSTMPAPIAFADADRAPNAHAIASLHTQ